MPILANAKHEKFAQAIASGVAGTPAWLAVSPNSKPESAAVSASRLLKDAKVAARIAELNAPAIAALERGQDAAVTSAERIVQEAAAIAFSDIRGAVSWDRDGMTLTDSGELTPEMAAAIKEVRIVRTPGEHGDRLERRITLYDKMAALALLAKRHPEFRDTTPYQPNQTLVLSGLSDDQLDLAIRRLSGHA